MQQTSGELRTWFRNVQPVYVELFNAAYAMCGNYDMAEYALRSAILDAWLPVCYAGVLSSGVAYTLQIVGQKDLNPTVASIIMSLEACVSVIAAWIILGDAMDARQITGCAIMFAAIILAQIPMPQKKERKLWK